MRDFSVRVIPFTTLLFLFFHGVLNSAFAQVEGTIEVTKWLDEDGDGTPDVPGTGVEFTVQTMLGAEVAHGVTDSLGQVFFLLSPDTYKVFDLANMLHLDPVDGIRVIEVRTNETSSIQFVNRMDMPRDGPANSIIHITKFEDTDGDGSPDTTVVGWLIELFRDGQLLRRDRTYIQGTVTFKGLLAGDNEIVEESRQGWAAVNPPTGRISHTLPANVQLVASFINEQVAGGVGIEEDEVNDLPNTHDLLQNYPNPFNPVTTIEYAIPVAENVRIEVFNLFGQRVAILVNEDQSAGQHQIRFDSGFLSTGVYQYRMTAGNFFRSRSFVFVK
ncbi:MAG: T9SS type A sorting domain-containing protein [Bacteroidetes bacterium]|nr:T9SS type A sorting domain-containing protein [Bacteroidota bacterium]